jgi:hypothetical protein
VLPWVDVRATSLCCFIHGLNLYMCLHRSNTYHMGHDDGTDGAPCFRMASYAWVFAARLVSNQKQYKVAMCVEQLRSLRCDLQAQHERSEADINTNRKTVLALCAKGTGKRDLVVVNLLKRSVVMKKARVGLAGRMNTIDTQIDAIESSDFNSNMLKTMQTTANVMRKMGLDKGLSQADTTISELEDNMHLVADMNEALAGTTGDPSYLNDDELDAELDAILHNSDMLAHDVRAETHTTSHTPDVVVAPTPAVRASPEVPAVPDTTVTMSVPLVSTMRETRGTVVEA